MNQKRGTERRGRRNSKMTATILRQAIERMAAGDEGVSIDELRRHLSRARRNLARVRALGGRYLLVQMSPHTAPLDELLARRRAG